jgi:hypothetical protein
VNIAGFTAEISSKKAQNHAKRTQKSKENMQKLPLQKRSKNFSPAARNKIKHTIANGQP